MNTTSCRVLQKAGFTCEGTLRSNTFKNGNIVDMKMYARLYSKEGTEEI
jgi:RimJ/RimL family protein N-acetyltransferase